MKTLLKQVGLRAFVSSHSTYVGGGAPRSCSILAPLLRPPSSGAQVLRVRRWCIHDATRVVHIATRLAASPLGAYAADYLLASRTAGRFAQEALVQLAGNFARAPYKGWRLLCAPLVPQVRVDSSC